eukprot:2912926-Rhodomonas_salina.2
MPFCAGLRCKVRKESRDTLAQRIPARSRRGSGTGDDLWWYQSGTDEDRWFDRSGTDEELSWIQGRSRMLRSDDSIPLHEFQGPAQM